MDAGINTFNLYSETTALNLNKEYLKIEYRKLGKITIDEKDCDIDHGITDIIDFSSWHKLPEGVLCWE